MHPSPRYTPLPAVEALIEGYSEACQLKEEGDSGNGNLPLHTACETKARPEVTQLLIKTFPEATNQTNDLGNLPIHYASEKQCTPEVMTMTTINSLILRL